MSDTTPLFSNPVQEARDALERVQKGRVWFEPYSTCLDDIVAAIKALDKLAGYDAVAGVGGTP